MLPTPPKMYDITLFTLNNMIHMPECWACSVDSDQMSQNAAYDQGLHCLPLILQC